jgi:hypothetical protein
MGSEMCIPYLAGVATSDLVERIGSGNFSASYINWSRTLELLRKNAPGWMIETVPASDGGILHRAPVGGYVLLQFRHVTGYTTPPVPQAVMDTRNNAVPFDKITARDITDTHRRGACLAAAMTFGLAYELWAKMPLESGYVEQAEDSAPAIDKGEVMQPLMEAAQKGKAAFLEAWKAAPAAHKKIVTPADKEALKGIYEEADAAGE